MSGDGGSAEQPAVPILKNVLDTGAARTKEDKAEIPPFKKIFVVGRSSNKPDLKTANPVLFHTLLAEGRKTSATTNIGAPTKSGGSPVVKSGSAVSQSSSPAVRQRCSFAGCNYVSLSEMAVRTHETRAHPKSRKCSFCEHVAPSQKDLVKHVHRFHANENSLSCDRCSYRGVNEARLLTHQRLKHGFSAKQERRHLACRETDKSGTRCTERFMFMSQLRSHLAEHHRIMSADLKLTQHFQTIDDFNKWKLAYDRESGANYRLVAKPLVAGICTMFACSRSGRCRVQGYENQGFKCTSTIRASSTFSGRVYVTLFPFHYGHDHEESESDQGEELMDQESDESIDFEASLATMQRVVKRKHRDLEDSGDKSVDGEDRDDATESLDEDRGEDAVEAATVDEVPYSRYEEVVATTRAEEECPCPSQTVIVLTPKRRKSPSDDKLQPGKPSQPLVKRRNKDQNNPLALPAREGRQDRTAVGQGASSPLEKQAEAMLQELIAARGNLSPEARSQITIHLGEIRGVLARDRRAREAL